MTAKIIDINKAAWALRIKKELEQSKKRIVKEQNERIIRQLKEYR